ncbi:aldehyde dehydrogenase family protein, partial [Vibrio breoganii]
MTQWIAGQWVAGQGDAMTSVSPYNNEVVWQGDSATPAQVESAVAAARDAFLVWKKLSFAEREAVVLNFAEKVKENSEEIAQI